MPEFDYLSGSGGTIDTVIRARAALLPTKPFLEQPPDRLLTFSEFDAAVEVFAAALEAEGIRRGDRVVVYMGNCIEYIVAMFGIQRIGAVYSPCGTLLAPEEVSYQTSHSGARLVLTNQEFAPTIRGIRANCPTVETVVVIGDDVEEDEVPYSNFLDAGRESHAAGDRPLAAADDFAMLIYTSGTTARPKAVMFSHGNLVVGAMGTSELFEYKPSDRFLHHFPLFHVNGGLIGVTTPLFAGASLVMVPKFSASSFSRHLCDYQITFTSVNATHCKMLLNTPPTPYDRDHLARRMMFGLSMTAERIRQFEERYNTTLCPTYGTTEVNTIMIGSRPSAKRAIGSAGRVMRGYVAKIVDDEGTEIGAKEEGQLVVRSTQRHGITLGYYKDPERTAAAYRGGWYWTGDRGYFDLDGFFWFTGRGDDMIKRSGFNVSPAEIERVIRHVAGVASCAVVGTPDAIREEAIIAFVTLEGGRDAPINSDVILAHCKANLAEYKIPQAINIVDSIPENYLGKVDYKELRVWALAYEVSSTERPSPDRPRR